MEKGGLREELQKVVLQGSWQTGTKLQERVAELTKSQLMTAKSSCARRQKEMRVKAGEVWTVKLKSLEIEGPRKPALDTSTLEMGWHVHVP